MSSAEAGAPAAPSPRASLSARLIAILFFIAFLLVLAASAVLYAGMLSVLQSADDQVIDKRAATIAEQLAGTPPNEGFIAHEVNDDNQGPRQIFIRIVSSVENIALETEGMGKHLDPSLFPQLAKGDDRRRATIVSAEGQTFRAVSRRVPVGSAGSAAGGEALLQVATDTTLDEATLAQFRQILFLVIGASLPACALASWLVVKRELTPLARIAAATRTIDAGSIASRLPLENLPAELHEFASQFNAMLGRIEAALGDLEHYADTIAHELRTPLNRMRLNCEIALGKADTADELRDVMVTNLTECERLTRLMNGLLFLARAGHSRASLESARVSAADEIKIVHEFFKSDAAERGITLLDASSATPPIAADRDLFKQALANLVANALAHTRSGGTVTIGCESARGNVLIHVEDTGPGIAAADMPHIFKRFYRAAGAPPQGTRLGLGLAIAKSIADIHGGSISVSSEPGRGARFTLAFPAAQRIVA